jgi:hypothetical protein
MNYLMGYGESSWTTTFWRKSRHVINTNVAHFRITWSQNEAALAYIGASLQPQVLGRADEGF